MAYQETSDLGCDKTFSLGGIRTDKKTGKKFKNPKEVEGYYIGTKKGIDTGNDKPSNLHFFEGEVKNDKGETIFTGKVGIWGKTDLDRKASQWKVGLMTKAYFDKMQDPSEVKRGRKQMYLYKGFQDPDNVNAALVAASGEETFEEEPTQEAAEEVTDEVTEEAYEEEASLEAEEEAVDEVPAKPAKKPAKPATPSSDRQAAMQKLVGSGKTATKTA